MLIVRLVSMKSILVAAVIALTLAGQQAFAYTSFDFGNVAYDNGTEFSAILFDEDGEYLQFRWTFVNNSFVFDKSTSLAGIWDGLDNSWNMSPTDKFNIIDKMGTFVINGTDTTGNRVMLCIDDKCEDAS